MRHNSDSEQDRQKTPVEWQEIRRRIEAPIIEERTPEAARALLEERARRLAAPVSAAPADVVEAVTFQLAGETYGVAAASVFGVFPLRTLTLVPGVRESVLGITEWRGDLLSILDLRRLLGLPVTELNDLSVVIVLGNRRPAFGILGDAIAGVTTFVEADLYRPDRGSAAASPCALGMMKDATIILNAQVLLASSPSKSN